MQITIAESLTLTVAIAALLGMSRLPEHDEYIWFETTLVYESPIAPVEFNDNGREPPYATFAGILMQINLDEWKDGPSYFKSAHRRGWESCRYSFVSGENVVKQSPPELTTLPVDSWDHHGEYAFALGYNACFEQIAVLLDRYPNSKLINRICCSKRLIGAALIAMFLLAIGTFFAMRCRTGRTTN